jgi:hypothetical protein
MKLAAGVALVCWIGCKSPDAPPPSPSPGSPASAGSPAPVKPAEPAKLEPAKPTPAKPASLDDGFLIAGRSDVTNQFFVARVTPQAVTEISHEALEPSQLLWIDSHFLVAITNEQIGQSEDYDVRLRWYIDGQPNERRGKGGEIVQAAAWPAGFRGASTRLMTTPAGHVWLGRKHFEGARATQEMYMRVDAMPRKVQAEPPADLDVVRSNLWPLSHALSQAEDKAKRDALPKADHGPDGATLALKKVAGGLPGVECTDGKRTTTWPTGATHPFIRLHVEDAHWLSATLPLWIAVGHNPDHPDGDLVGSEVFLGCSKAPLAEARWLGGDVWATLEAGEWSNPKDSKHWVIWNGATKLATTAATSPVFEAAPR